MTKVKVNTGPFLIYCTERTSYFVLIFISHFTPALFPPFFVSFLFFFFFCYSSTDLPFFLIIGCFPCLAEALLENDRFPVLFLSRPMSKPFADDAASCPKATAKLWAKLDEVLKLLAHQQDAKKLFNKYVVVRSVVGEVKPVFSDALRIRLKVFCDEQGLATRTECDDFEAISVHAVAYFNYTLFTEEMEELAVQARLLKSIGMEGSGLRFQRRRKSASAIAAVAAGAEGSDGSGNAEASTSSTATAADKLRKNTISGPPEGRYKPPVMIPVGSMRLRRAAKARHAGKLHEVVAFMERLCVVKSVRNFDIGRMLMTAAEDIARDACHVRWALLYAPLEMREFYIKVGYVAKDGWIFYEDGEPHLVMIKCLADACL